MRKKKTLKYNKVELGLLVGILIPLISIFIFYLFNIEKYNSLRAFYREMVIYGIFTSVLSLCALPNLLAFFAFLKFELYYSARGVILATLVYTFLVIFIKF